MLKILEKRNFNEIKGIKSCNVALSCFKFFWGCLFFAYLIWNSFFKGTCSIRCFHMLRWKICWYYFNSLSVLFVVIWVLKRRWICKFTLKPESLVFKLNHCIYSSWNCFYFDLLIEHICFKNLAAMVYF